jgi:glutamine synthetase
MDPNAVMKYATDQGAKFVSIRFTDFPGSWQHLIFPIAELRADAFDAGFGFDASSIRGWAAIHESDMLLLPDPTRFWMDPFAKEPTICLIGDTTDPITKRVYAFDPRAVAIRAESYLKSTGLADVACFGPEAEFFVFDSVRFHNEENSAGYEIDSWEGHWNTGRERDEIGSRNLGYHVRSKEGYVPCSPVDTLSDLRSAISLTLAACGITVECHHHEVATAGQCEIDFRYSGLLATADNLQIFKYIVRNTAAQQGKAATFMPKPLFGDNGSGMHCHQSLWKENAPLFAGDGYGGFSEMGLYYIGGLLKHAAAVIAFAAPTTNSYKRLVPGFEAPVNLAYSARNRSAAIRIPMFHTDPKLKRLEFRPPDPSCNPYLAFSAMLMAGLDGIQKQIHPGEPLEKDIYELSPKELTTVPTLPGSLDESLKALEQDHDFLLVGDVFTPQIIERWIRYKREKEIVPLRLRPHPLEYSMYFDV